MIEETYEQRHDRWDKEARERQTSMMIDMVFIFILVFGLIGLLIAFVVSNMMGI